jgi:hypothetical protein
VSFVTLLATSVAYLGIFVVITVVTDSGIAGFATATGLLALFLVVKSEGFRPLLERIRNSSWLDERPAIQERERKTDAGLRE